MQTPVAIHVHSRLFTRTCITATMIGIPPRANNGTKDRIRVCNRHEDLYGLEEASVELSMMTKKGRRQGVWSIKQSSSNSLSLSLSKEFPNSILTSATAPRTPFLQWEKKRIERSPNVTA